MSLRSRGTLPLLRGLLLADGSSFPMVPSGTTRIRSSPPMMRPSIDDLELAPLFGGAGLDFISTNPDSVVVVLERVARAERRVSAVA